MQRQGFDPFKDSGVNPSGFGVGTESGSDDNPFGGYYFEQAHKAAMAIHEEIGKFMPTILRAVDAADKALNGGGTGLHELYYNFIFDPRYDPRREFRRCAVSEECGSGYICNGGRCQFVGGDENPAGDGCTNKKDKFFDIPDKPPWPSCRKSNPQKRPKARSCGAPAPGVVPAGKSCVPIVWPKPEKPWCGTKCCSCGTSGCNCQEGECPPPGQRCTRFCDEAGKSGSNVLRCGFKKCEACQYCKMVEDPEKPNGKEVPRCVRQTYSGADCRCGYICPGCRECNFAGECEQRVCPGPKKPPPPPIVTCEPVCRDTEVCVTNTELGTVTCNTVQQCEDLPADCEPCDCNCNDECGDCEVCNEAGKCVQDPKCKECFPDTLYWTKGPARTTYYTKATGECVLLDQITSTGGEDSGVFETECGPLRPVMRQPPIQVPTNYVLAEGCPPGSGIYRGDVRVEQTGYWDVYDGNDVLVGSVSFGFKPVTGNVNNSTATPSIVTFNR